jgi:hypothetical protein
VNDLIDEPNNKLSSQGVGAISNAIDKETKNLAMMIKKNPNFKTYK